MADPVNATQVTYFILNAYFDGGAYKYLFFVVTKVLYISIVFANVLLIAVICAHRSLYEPMYLFMCSLFVNELFGSSSLLPFVLAQMLSDRHVVSTSVCFLQIFGLHTYGGCEIVNLAIMAYDRYLAICHPLQYNSLMSVKKVFALIAVTWFIGTLSCAFVVALSFPLQLCGNVIDKVYCDNYHIVRLACSDTTVNNVFGIVWMFTIIFSFISFTLYSYVRILIICFLGSAQMRQKAFNTCTPHVVSLINFSVGAFFEIIQGRFDMNSLPIVLRIFLSMYFLTVQPLLSPLMYGLKLTKVRIICKTLLFGKRLEDG